MDVFEAMRKRQSIRKFTREAVPREKILKMVEAALEAPTAGNTQNFRFIVVQDKDLLARMKGIVDQVFERVTGKAVPPDKLNYHNLFAAAPAAVCVVGMPYESATDKDLRRKDPERLKARRFHVNPGLQGISAGIMQFLLAARAMEYGTCWMTGPLVAKPELESVLQIGPPEELLAIIALGKPEVLPPKPARKTPSEVTTFR